MSVIHISLKLEGKKRRDIASRAPQCSQTWKSDYLKKTSDLAPTL